MAYKTFVSGERLTYQDLNDTVDYIVGIVENGY